MAVETVTLGCRLNFAETETMAALAPPDEDWIIVNSCAVTNEAVRQTRQAIRHAHRRRPDVRIMVAGCAVELDPQRFRTMPEVSRIVGNDDKMHAFTRHPGREPGPALSSALPAQGGQIPGQARDDGQSNVKTPVVPAGLLHRVKSFVAIQTGCDHRCTFCAIWQARGASRSLPFEAVRDAVARELDRGAKEIILTGVDITDYEGGLGILCQKLLAAEPRLLRLRLSSLDSIEMDDALFELIAGEARLMPHFHLSLQAGDDLILKRMKRRHGRADAIRVVERIKSARADATIGADLIAGFPTETEEMAANSLKLLDDCDIVAAHVFPFSPRPDTPAARMPKVDPRVVKMRSARLRGRAAERRTRWLNGLVGSTQRVLVEGGGKGHSDAFAPVAIADAERGQVIAARIAARSGDHLVGIRA